MTDEVLAEGQRLFDEVKQLKKQNMKLQQQLNRITNLMIGNERIWVLDRLAMELEVEADLLSEKPIGVATSSAGPGETVQMVTSLPSLIGYERINQFKADALFLRRLEWDLGELHVAVKGDTARRGGRYDQSEWRGSRP